MAGKHDQTNLVLRVVTQRGAKICHRNGFGNMRSEIGNIMEQSAVTEKSVRRHSNNTDLGIFEYGVIRDQHCLIVRHVHIQNHGVEFLCRQHCKRLLRTDSGIDI